MSDSSTLKSIQSSWSSHAVNVGDELSQTFSLKVDSSQIAILTPKQNLQFLGSLENVHLEVDGDLYQWTLDWKVVDQTSSESLIHKVVVFDTKGQLLNTYDVNTEADEFPKVNPIEFSESWTEELSELSPQVETVFPWETFGLVILLPIVWFAYKMRVKQLLKREWANQQNLTLLKLKLRQAEKSLSSTVSDQVGSPLDNTETRVKLFKLSEVVLREIYSPGKKGISWKNLHKMIVIQDDQKVAKLDQFLKSDLKQRHKTTTLKEFHQIVLKSLDMLNTWQSFVYAPMGDSALAIDETELEVISNWVNLLEVKHA